MDTVWILGPHGQAINIYNPSYIRKNNSNVSYRNTWSKISVSKKGSRSFANKTYIITEVLQSSTKYVWSYVMSNEAIEAIFVSSFKKH